MSEPTSSVSLKLSVFEGPLDLLMHLIERDKLDIYDIPIVSITEQYMLYLKNLSEFDMEIASEFLVMAATLLQIKSRMLLPKEPNGEEEEEQDPRQQLVEMLLQYRRAKELAKELTIYKERTALSVARRPLFADMVQRILPQYGAEDLLKALAGMLREQKRPSAYIEPQAFSVEKKMTAIMQLLEKRKQGFPLSELFSSGKPGEKVASFLGVLELLKMGLIVINQSAHFAPIYIFAKQGERSHDL